MTARQDNARTEEAMRRQAQERKKAEADPRCICSHKESRHNPTYPDMYLEWACRRLGCSCVKFQQREAPP